MTDNQSQREEEFIRKVKITKSQFKRLSNIARKNGNSIRDELDAAVNVYINLNY